MSPEMAAAISFIQSLKPGDRVRVAEYGQTYEMGVTTHPTLCDGRHGPMESIGVTVSFGPGRYSRRVQADNLVAVKRGRGTVGGGVEMERIATEPEAPCLF
ncbi:hypothetical protein [Streptomyces sp. NPDC091259]|uniref:hypothetical protein n=1 Tax=Streptomyces sp. NPDC091259 TaxID=3365976 RepID=UPI003828380A